MTQNITTLRYPAYYNDKPNWTLWRLVYEGGDSFVDYYLKQFSKREDINDFDLRKSITPIPAFAKAAVNDIRNSIFQRLGTVQRTGGSDTYQSAMEGQLGGVDLYGNCMKAFFGSKVLTDLLIMGKVGIYVDAPEFSGQTLAGSQNVRPYLYMYAIEDILTWSFSRPGETSEFQAVLLRDHAIKNVSLADYGINVPIEFPQSTFERYRLVYIDPTTKRVMVQFYNTEGSPVDVNNTKLPSLSPFELNLDKIPFILLDIGDSVLKDVGKHQIALLNLGSTDVNYAIKANFAIYTEQGDLSHEGIHLDGPSADGTAMAGDQPGVNTERTVGSTGGIRYDIQADRPGFIYPSSEPLRASIDLQHKLEDDIRKLVNLAVANKAAQPPSAEARDMDNQGLEAGLSFIGLVLETGERKVADHWSAYENKEPSKRKIAIVQYPNRYNLKTDSIKLDEAAKLLKVLYTLPSQTIKREAAKQVVNMLLSGRISSDLVTKICDEIDKAPYTISDPTIIGDAKDKGLCSDETASQALGFNKGEAELAAIDHAARAARILKAQTAPGARGVTDVSSDPTGDVQNEKQQLKQTDTQTNTSSQFRGAANE